MSDCLRLSVSFLLNVMVHLLLTRDPQNDRVLIGTDVTLRVTCNVAGNSLSVAAI